MLEWQVILVKIKLIPPFSCQSFLLLPTYLFISFSFVPSDFGSGALKDGPFKVIEIVVFAITRPDNASFKCSPQPRASYHLPSGSWLPMMMLLVA